MTRSERIYRTTVVISWFVSCLLCSCSESKKEHTIETTETFVGSTGMVAADLQSPEDYLSLGVVQEIFEHMQRHPGSAPPDLTGEYESDDQAINFTTIPGENVGDVLPTTRFCFGASIDGVLDALVKEDTLVDEGAGYFIEGSGDVFTAYLAHKSVQTDPEAGTCEIHMVRIFSGERQEDGRLSPLEVGIGIIGLIGDCGSLLLGDVRVSRGNARRLGSSCLIDTPPLDPSLVLVEIENKLIVDLEVYISNDGFNDQTLLVGVPPEDSTAVQVAPGFELYFESVQPQLVPESPIGEVLFKLFEPDVTPAGGAITYIIEHNIEGNLFFSPVVTNNTDTSLLPVVNVGIPDTPEGWFCAPCFIDPGRTEALGYYAYDILGELADTGELFEWTADKVNIHFFLDAADVPMSPVFVLDEFELPDFALEAESGVIELILFSDGSTTQLQ